MERIIIDTDPGVDDAMAILMACKATDKLKLEALTVVDGNVSLDKVSKNALGILELCHMEHVPVYQGASHPLKSKQNYSDDFHGNNGMGDVEIKAKTVELQKEPAVDYLIRMAKENKGEITIVPIGPLTNIALAIQKDKDFANNVKRLVIMGGAESGGNVTPVAEFNFFHDPEAAKIVFDANITDEEIDNCIALAQKHHLLLILQPKMSGNSMDISSVFAVSVLDKFLSKYNNVRLIPQVHKFISVR